jgi:hypothetical protein
VTIETIDQFGEIKPSLSAMPPEIAKGVVAVMKKIKMLGVDDKNQHGGYNYVSVDKFFDHVGRLMAEADIFDLIDEVSTVSEKKEAVDSYGKAKVSAWLTCTYDIFLFHASGAQFGPIRRTVQVQASGPQSYGSGMSFVEKYFLRGLFKIPTGEKDADDHPVDGLPEAVAVKTAIKPKAAAPIQATMIAEESELARVGMMEKLARTLSREDLHDWAKAHSETKNRLIAADQKLVSNAFAERQQAIKEADANG